MSVVVQQQRRPLGEIGTNNAFNLNNVPAGTTPQQPGKGGFPRSSSSLGGVLPTSGSGCPLSPLADEKYKEDPQLAADYVKEIYEHLRAVEDVRRPAKDYFDRQGDINERMRTIVVSWLVEVHGKFRLKPETLHLSVNLIDRFLDKKQCTRDKFQLIGMVAFWIASKYEDIYPPEADKLVYMSSNTYRREQMIRYERMMLTDLEFNLTVPTAFPFLKRFLQVSEADEVGHHLAGYLSELALLEYGMLEFLPSCVAAGTIYLANKLRGLEAWSRTLEHYSGYRAQDLEGCVRCMFKLATQSQTKNYQAVRKKYQNPKLLEVSRLVTEASCAAVEIP